MNNVSVFHNIILALGADETLFPCGGKRAALNEVFKGDDLRADKAAFKIGMDLSGGLRSLCTLFKRPCSDLGLTCGEVRDKTEQVIALPDEQVKAALLNAEIGKENFPVLL